MPDAGVASHMIVVAKSSQGIELRLVNLQDSSVTVTPQKNIDTSKSFYKVEFNNTPSTLLGQSGEGWNYILSLIHI